MIDLRSDTVTKPTPGMLKAMSKAKVGDDVFGEDPTVNAFQDKMAQKFGFEAGLFVTSGVMANQVALNLITRPGHEVLIDGKGHVFNYENTSAAWLSSIQLKPLGGKQGKLNAGLISQNIRGRFDWEPQTSAVILENTTNKGGGVCYRENELEAIKEAADTHNLKIHLDGARIWNAIVATQTRTAFFGEIADTMSISFSKGLGAPVGSMLLASRSLISKARRIRKMLGGGMRQIGLLAAAAKYGVDNHLKFLEEDHRRAKSLAETISQCGELSIDMKTVETNIVIFDTPDRDASGVLQKLEANGIQMVPFGPHTIRATFHFEITDENLTHVQNVLINHFN